MDSLTVDNIYGQALFDVAKDRGITEEIGEEYKEVSRVFADNPLLKKLFLLPTLSALEKKDVAEKIFAGRISQELMGFICILIDRRRVNVWDDIGKHYAKLVWESNGLTKGVIYSVVPMDQDRIKAFEKKTGAETGKKVSLENRVDKSLIGGVRIYIDGKLIDASVKTRLEAMKQRMKQ
jgi:ATP synthase F1 delta subunit